MYLFLSAFVEELSDLDKSLSFLIFFVLDKVVCGLISASEFLVDLVEFIVGF
jgi:hypothetical protein